MSLGLSHPSLRPDAGWRGCCALIPVKERLRCKSRLGPQLDAARRVALVRAMLRRVLAATAGARCIVQTIVVSPERDLVPAEVPVLADTGEGLNEALTRARDLLLKVGCPEILVLPADLPALTSAEIDGLVAAGRRGGFAIAPDAAGTGTNALYLGPSATFGFRFGPGSRDLHLQEAWRAGLAPEVVSSPGLAFDVDLPADLGRLEGESWQALLRP
jgi:2-phospho-L-lactate guanylyltransferase